MHIYIYIYVYIYIYICRRLIDNANAPIIGVDKKGNVTEWNRKASDMLGYSKQETMGQNLVERFIETRNQSRVAAVLQNAMSGQETANFECTLLSKTSFLYTVLLNATERRTHTLCVYIYIYIYIERDIIHIYLFMIYIYIYIYIYI